MLPRQGPRKEEQYEEYAILFPLHHAVHKNNRDELAKLIRTARRLGTGIDTKDRQGRTALYMAVAAVNIITTCQLVDAGADLATTDNRGVSLAHILMCSQAAIALQLLDMLAQFGMPLNKPGPRGLRPVHTAVIAGYREPIHILHKWGVDIGATSPQGTAAMMARKRQKHELARYIDMLVAERKRTVRPLVTICQEVLARCTAEEREAYVERILGPLDTLQLIINIQGYAREALLVEYLPLVLRPGLTRLIE